MAEPKTVNEPEKESTELSTKAHVRHNPKHLLAVVIAVVAILFVGAFLGRVSTGYRRMHDVNGFNVGGSGFSKMSMRVGPGADDGPTLSTSSGSVSSNQNVLNGVVTAVNGSTLTVTGNGATNTVQTSSSTEYTGGSSAAVNDTVVVFGSINNNTFTAKRIIVNP